MIEFDFACAGIEEQRLKEASEKLCRMSEDVYAQTVQELRQGWQGENARKFMERAVILQEKMEQTKETIRLADEALHQAAVKAGQMEKRTEEIAKERGRVR